MSTTIGVVDFNNTHEWESSIKSEENSINFVSLKLSELKNIDGVLFCMATKEDFVSLMDWIIDCKKFPNLLIWVHSKIKLDQEKNILLNFGVLDISDNEDLSHSFTKITNLFISLNESQSQSQSLKIINPKNQSVYINGTEKRLTRLEFNLLTVLLDYTNEAVTRDYLFKTLWKNKTGIPDYRVANLIFNLRKKLKDSEYIQLDTVHGVGYMIKQKSDIVIN